MMGNWVFIMLIVGIVTFGWVMVERQRTQKGITRDWMGNETINRQGDDQEKAQLLREVEELRERVKVLERIATDENDTKRLSAEIDKLRDE